MGRILRWGLLQLCQSLVNGLYLRFPIWKPAPGNGGHRAFEFWSRIQIVLIEYNLVSYRRTRQVM